MTRATDDQVKKACKKLLACSKRQRDAAHELRQAIEEDRLADKAYWDALRALNTLLRLTDEPGEEG